MRLERKSTHELVAKEGMQTRQQHGKQRVVQQLRLSQRQLREEHQHRLELSLGCSELGAQHTLVLDALLALGLGLCLTHQRSSLSTRLGACSTWFASRCTLARTCASRLLCGCHGGLLGASLSSHALETLILLRP